MELDCIPAGMELFPAMDEEQFEFIKKIIDDCDYYLLIIGGRYGSVTSEGVSYTEKEFDYALSRGIKIIALLHQNPADLALSKSEVDNGMRERLDAFRTRASTDRLVKYWSKAEELPGIVALSLSKTIKTYPAIGWVRADQVQNSDLLAELNGVRKQNEQLRKLLMEKPPKEAPIANLAGIHEEFVLHGRTFTFAGANDLPIACSVTWAEIFAWISPYLIERPVDQKIKSVVLSGMLSKLRLPSSARGLLDDQSFMTVSVQLRALGLVRLEHVQMKDGRANLFWNETPTGQAMMFNLRGIRSQIKQPEKSPRRRIERKMDI